MNILQIGETIGEAIGRDRKLIELVCCKLKKSKSIEQIAEELEEEMDVIAAICKAAEAAAPDYDSDVVYQNWKANGKG